MTAPVNELSINADYFRVLLRANEPAQYHRRDSRETRHGQAGTVCPRFATVSRPQSAALTEPGPSRCKETGDVQIRHSKKPVVNVAFRQQPVFQSRMIECLH